MGHGHNRSENYTSEVSEQTLTTSCTRRVSHKVKQSSKHTNNKLAQIHTVVLDFLATIVSHLENHERLSTDEIKDA
jgi:hypothetical protein